MSNSPGQPYEIDDRFSGYYLEDSYVLSVDSAADFIAFRLELVLTPGHPRYRQPSPNEQHSYARGQLAFTQVTQSKLELSQRRAAIDANGDTDIGNIDLFRLLPGNRYLLSGDWGTLDVTAGKAAIVLDR